MSPSAVKQASWLSGLSATASPRRLGAGLRLGRVAEREHGGAELPGGEHGQHVGLVLAGIGGQVQGAVDDLRVVAGAHRVEAEGEHAVEHRRELDLLVAPQARFGVRPAAYSVTKSSTTSRWNRSAMSHT